MIACILLLKFWTVKHFQSLGATQVKKDQLESLDQLDQKERKDPEESKDHKEVQELQDQLVKRELQDSPVHKVLWVTMGLLV
jgi:hypothetical protein